MRRFFEMLKRGWNNIFDKQSPDLFDVVFLMLLMIIGVFSVFGLIAIAVNVSPIITLSISVAAALGILYAKS
jgi:hypothetical protein